MEESKVKNHQFPISTIRLGSPGLGIPTQGSDSQFEGFLLRRTRTLFSRAWRRDLESICPKPPFRQRTRSDFPGKAPTLPTEAIERRILLVRGQKVLLDSDLASLYGVTTFNLNKAVKRNIERFPVDFMFQLTNDEADVLRFQVGMSKPAGSGGRRYLPYVFTEQGVAMLSSVLRCKQAVQVNIAIMRVFVRLREILGTHKDLARK